MDGAIATTAYDEYGMAYSIWEEHPRFFLVYQQTDGNRFMKEIMFCPWCGTKLDTIPVK